METKTYKITHPNVKGAGYILYKEGLLNVYYSDFELAVNVPLTGREVDLNSIRNAGFDFFELKAKTVAEKMMAFCTYYRAAKGHAYRATKEERANIGLVAVTTPLLKTYFETTSYPLISGKSIADYIRHYNTIRDLSTNGKPVKSSLPDVYDMQYEKTIGDDTSKLQRYWQHLRDLGWRKVDGVWTQQSKAITLNN